MKSYYLSFLIITVLIVVSCRNNDNSATKLTAIQTALDSSRYDLVFEQCQKALSDKTDPSVSAEICRYLACTWAELDNSDSIQFYANKALVLSRPTENTAFQASCYYLLYKSQNEDSLLTQSANMYRSLNNLSLQEVSYKVLVYIALADTCREMTSAKIAKRYLDTATTILLDTATYHLENTVLHAKLYKSLGDILYNNGQYAQADSIDNLRLKVYENYPNHPLYGQALQNVGASMSQQGNYLEGMPYIEKGMKVVEKAVLHYNAKHILLAKGYQNLSACYLDIEDYVKAKDFSLKAAAIDSNKSANLGNIYTLLYQNDKANIGYKDSAYIYHKKLINRTQGDDLGRFYDDFARYWLFRDSLSTAIVYCKKAIDKNYIDALCNIGNLYEKTGQYIDALKAYQNYITDIKKQADLTLDERRLLMESLIGQAKVYGHLFDKSKDKNLLLKAIHHIDAFVTQFEAYQRLSKLEINPEKLFKIGYQIGVFAYLKLYELSHNTPYLLKAFELSEKSKNAFLLHNLTEQAALSELQPIEQALMKTTQQGLYAKNPDVVIEAIKNVEILIRQFEQKYPDYKTKKSPLTYSFDTISHQLQPNEVLIEYLQMDKEIIVFVIPPSVKTPIYYRINREKETIDRTVDAFLYQIKKESYEYTRRSTDKAVCDSLGYVLYQTLVQPLENHIKKEQHLIIVGDDEQIGDIPYGALYSQNPSKSDSIGNYLGYQHPISLNVSATLLTQQRLVHKDKLYNKNKEIVGFAPSFSDRDNVDKLDNGQIVKLLFDDLKGASYIDKAATKKVFEAQSPKYGLLYLDTHAFYDKEDSRYGYLLFTQNNASAPIITPETQLTAQEITGLNLNKTQLVILNTCKSGGNPDRQPVHLATSFLLAGSSAVIATKWSVNNEKGRDFMNGLLPHIQEGNAVDALWKAQRELISHPKDKDHPFYWAVYYLIGNTHL